MTQRRCCPACLLAPHALVDPRCACGGRGYLTLTPANMATRVPPTPADAAHAVTIHFDKTLEACEGDVAAAAQVAIGDLVVWGLVAEPEPQRETAARLSTVPEPGAAPRATPATPPAPLAVITPLRR